MHDQVAKTGKMSHTLPSDDSRTEQTAIDRLSGYNFPARRGKSDAGTLPGKSTKVGSIKRRLISNLECYNAAGSFSEIVDGKTL